MSDEKSNGKTDEQKARELLEATKRKREQDCLNAIRATCEQYRCKLAYYEVRKDGKVFAVDIMAEAIE